MKTIRVKIDVSFPAGRVDKSRLDATTELELGAQQKVDDAEAMMDAAKFARRVRKRMG